MELFVGAKGLVVHERHLLLLRESTMYEEGTEQGKWDFPGRRIKPEELLREGLVREVREESGLSVAAGELLGAFDGFPTIHQKQCHVVRLYFLCSTREDVVTLSDDHDAYAWVTLKEATSYDLMDDLREVIRAYLHPKREKGGI